MTTAYYAGFDVSALTVGTLTVADTSGGGGTSVVVTLPDVTEPNTLYSRFVHYFAGASGGHSYLSEGSSGETALNGWSSTSFAIALRTVIRAGIAAASSAWPSTETDFTVTFDNDTAVYTFAYPTQFSLTWSLSAGQALLGFTATQSGGTSYSSSVVPTYAVIASRACGSVTPNYENQDVGKLAVADDGLAVFAMSQPYAFLMRDWLQEFETKAKVRRLDATSSNPWTFQHLFEHCRCVNMFVVHDGFGESYAEAFTLRSDGANFSPRRVAPGYDVTLHIPFQCYVEAWLQAQAPA